MWAIEIMKADQGLDRWIAMVEDSGVANRANLYILKNPFAFETRLEAMLASAVIYGSDNAILGEDMHLELVSLIDEAELPPEFDEDELGLSDAVLHDLDEDTISYTEWCQEHGITMAQGRTPVTTNLTPIVELAKSTAEVLEGIANTLESMRLTVAEMKANELKKLFVTDTGSMTPERARDVVSVFAAEGLTVTDTKKAQEFLNQARSNGGFLDPVESPSDTPFMSSGTY